MLWGFGFYIVFGACEKQGTHALGPLPVCLNTKWAKYYESV